MSQHELHAFRETLSCPICRELLVNAPKMTDCGHTFCSECITRYLIQNSICPVCRHATGGGLLRPNKVVEDAAEKWAALEQNLHARLVKEAEAEESPRNGVESAVANSEMTETEETKLVQPDDSAKPRAGYGVCPLCSKQLPLRVLEAQHIDECLSRPAQSPSKSPQKRVTGPVFGQEYPQAKLSLPTALDSFTETKLRDRLRNQGISIKGNKTRLKQRYTEWVTIYNASVESRHPQTIPELRRRMSQWDRMQDQSHEAPNLKDVDAAQWTTAHQSDFDALVEQARQSKRRKTGR